MKKFATMAISVALIGTMIAGGSLAYLQSEDSDVNVMTLGNVSIEQHEYERVVENGNYATKEIDGVTSYVLKNFEQAKPLLPIVGDPSEPGNSLAYAGYDSTTVRMTQVGSYGGMDVFAGKNAQDKFVTVENTGKTDAYVRTLVAIEVGSTEDDGKLVKASYHFTWEENFIDTFIIDGNEYKLYEYVYNGWNEGGRHVNGVLPAGDTSYPNLSQIYLKHNADNEYCEALDGNGNGKLDILVLSQAVQAAGFENAQTALDTAFGKASEKAAEWFGGIANYEVVTDEPFVQNLDATEAYTIDGEGKTIIGVASSVDVFQWSDDGKIPAMSTIFSSADKTGAKATVNDITFTGTMSSVMAGNYVDTNSNWFNTEFNNVNIIDAEVVSFSAGISPALTVYGNMTMNNCEVTGTVLSSLDTDPMWPAYDVAVVNYSDTVINDSTIGSLYMWNQAKVTVADGTEVDTIVIRGNMNATKYGLIVESGAVVNAIDMTNIANTARVNITIEEGATVGAFVDNGVEYATLDAWKAAQ